MTELTPEQKLKMMEEALHIDKSGKAYAQQPKPTIKIPKLAAPAEEPTKWVKVKDTAEGLDMLIYTDILFLGKSWEDSRKALLESNMQMPTIRNYIDYRNTLASGNAFFADKTKFPGMIAVSHEKREPWSEYLDTEFELTSHGLYVKAANGSLTKHMHRLLKEDKMISLAAWLKDADSYTGLPKEGIDSGVLYYQKPKANCASAYMRGDEPVLRCDVEKHVVNSKIGVRPKIGPDSLTLAFL